MSLPRRVLALGLAALLLVGCRIDATVDVLVEDDGSGIVRVTVALDAAAASRGGVNDDLRTDDLEAAGWVVAPTETAADGSVALTAEKPFASAEQLPVVLAEVSSAFDRVGLDRDRSFGELRWTFRAVVDLSEGASALGDEQLAALLGGQPLGRDLATLEQEIGESVADATSLTLRVDMPGSATQQWAFRLGQQPTPVQADGTVTDNTARILAAVAIAAVGLVLLVLALMVLRARRRRRQRRARRQRPSRRLRNGETVGVPGLGRADIGVFDDEAAASGAMRTHMAESTLPGAPRVVGVERTPRRLQLVITTTNGVLWDPPDVAERWLGDMSAMQGGSTSIDEIRAVVHEAKLGRLTSAQLWRALGAEGQPEQLDAAYLSRFSLAPGVVDLVTSLARRGVEVACVSDDVAEWSTLLRGRFGLERFIQPWVLSAEVGARPPSPAVLEAVAEQASVAATNCLMVDVHVDMLDTALRLGMSTVLIGGDPAVARERGHGHAVDLAEMLARPRDAAARRP